MTVKKGLITMKQLTELESNSCCFCNALISEKIFKFYQKPICRDCLIELVGCWKMSNELK